MDYEKVKFILKNKDDLYLILGVTKESEIKDITRSHRRLALQLHPDKVACFSLPDLGPDVSERMKKEKQAREEMARSEASDAFLAIQRAYEILTDEKLRRTYDLGGMTDVKAAEQRGDMPFPPLWKVIALASYICLGSLDPFRRFVNTPHTTKNEKGGGFSIRIPPFSEWPIWSAEERRSMRPPPASSPKSFWGRLKWTSLIFIIFAIFGVALLNNVQTKAARTSSKNLRKKYDSVATKADQLLGELFSAGRRLPSTLKEAATGTLPEIAVPYFTENGLPLSPSAALEIQSHIIGELSMCAQMGYAPLSSSSSFYNSNSSASSQQQRGGGITPVDHLKRVIECSPSSSHKKSRFCIQQRRSRKVLGELIHEAVGSSRASLPQQLFMSAIAPLLHLCTSPNGGSSVASEASFITFQKRLSRYAPLANHLGFIPRLTMAAALEHGERGKTPTWTKLRTQEENRLHGNLTAVITSLSALRSSECKKVKKTKTTVNDKWGRSKVKFTRKVVDCHLTTTTTTSVE